MMTKKREKMIKNEVISRVEVVFVNDDDDNVLCYSIQQNFILFKIIKQAVRMNHFIVLSILVG